MNVLIIGNGFTGSQIGKELSKLHKVTVCSRNKRDIVPSCGWVMADATDREQLARVVKDTEPNIIVLVHGPSDITWCEANKQEAINIHSKIAENISLEAPHCYTALISTDNVFSGVKDICNETDNIKPANAYGEAKLACENIIIQKLHKHLILRVSLIYGWEATNSDKWKNFFAKTVNLLSNNNELLAPNDLWNTPVMVTDVAKVLSTLINNNRTGIFHLAGKDRLTRVQWAEIIADVFGYDKSLIKPISKSDTRYACRPTNACLNSVYLNKLPEMQYINILGVREAAEWLKENMQNFKINI